MSGEVQSEPWELWHWCTDTSCLIGWADNWQTLITGIAATAAAVVSVKYLRKQIESADRHERERRERRFLASRARLPLMLSSTVQYANEAIRLLKRYLDHTTAAYGMEALHEAPRPILPEDAIQAFEALIENTEDSDFAAYIADMIGQMQVLNSRLRSVTVEAGRLGAVNLHAYLMNAAKVAGYATGAFDFARRETDAPPHDLDWALVISALRLNEMLRDNYEELFAFIERARDRQRTDSEAGE